MFGSERFEATSNKRLAFCTKCLSGNKQLVFILFLNAPYQNATSNSIYDQLTSPHINYDYITMLPMMYHPNCSKVSSSKSIGYYTLTNLGKPSKISFGIKSSTSNDYQIGNSPIKDYYPSGYILRRY